MPPPPPPPQPAPGPPRGLKPPSQKTGGPVDRNALLSSIQKGAKLKKTVTNDRSSPLISSKVSTSVSSNGSIQGGSSGGAGVSNGGPPQLAGLFAGGMPKLRPTGRGLSGAGSATDIDKYSTSRLSTSKKSFAPRTPPSSAKPSPFLGSQNSLSASENNFHYGGSSTAPPSPKPSLKNNPAPPPPPSSRKPSMILQGTPASNPPPPPASKPVALEMTASKSVTDLVSAQPDQRHPPIPAKPIVMRPRPDSGQRGAPPPRPPSSSKPNLSTLTSSDNSSVIGESSRRSLIDRSVSMREPPRGGPSPPVRIGTSAESPAAPFRVPANHREAPPVPAARPMLSKTVGRAAGSRLGPALRHPSDRPRGPPPARPVVAAPPPPSQPPPPPPHRSNPPPGGSVSSGAPLPSSAKANVPLPRIPSSVVPPLPPERNESTRSLSSFATGRNMDEFESKFSSMFRSPHQFPGSIPYKNVQKIYPSKNNAKNQRRAPLPPTSHGSNPTSSGAHTQTSTGSDQRTTPAGIPSHPHPPPQPPHAPIHLQMNQKFYGTEASQC